MPFTNPFPAGERISRLEQQIEETEKALRDLRLQLEQAKLEVQAHQNHERRAETVSNGTRSWPLSATEYQRYGRQLIVPQIGLPGQLQLKKSKVLIVGVGGLGCPAAAYLAGAGVGTLGLMDGDTVDLSNLHRQIVHSTDRVGMSKVDSAYQSLQAINSEIQYNRHPVHLSSDQAISIFEQYDLVLDCTDHPTSRYLISDACVLTGKPLVSASALKTEGQLMVLHDPPKAPGDLLGGPCYRCIFPKPPPAHSVVSCGEGGIVGPVVGVMGVLQALEAIKLLTRRASTEQESVPASPPRASLLMFSAYSSPQFRTVRLRGRRGDCAVCSAQPTVTKQSLTSGSLDYLAFCGRTAPVKLLSPESRLSATRLAEDIRSGAEKMLIDVRDETQYAICALENSINVPWTGSGESWLVQAKEKGILDGTSKPKLLVCRFGNDSQLATKALLDHGNFGVSVKDLEGGLESWRQNVDHTWPDY